MNKPAIYEVALADGQKMKMTEETGVYLAAHIKAEDKNQALNRSFDDVKN